MKLGRLSQWLRLSLVAFLLLPVPALLAKNGENLIGQEVPFFTLPSSHGRAINYLNEYYGKHHLILTFFPAAFTPT